ncbi:MAG: GyrI-like domain-containing protein [Gemmataceae bacterium]
MRTSTKPTPATLATYLQRINRAIDHIVGHLDEPLRLRDLAQVALLSPFHFQKVFQAIVGVSPADFVRRRRLEKALVLMGQPRARSLTAIAMACGFTSSSDFSRSFKRQYGVAPSTFDIQGWRKANRVELEALVQSGHIDRLPPRHNPDAFRVSIRELPARSVAYIRVDRPYQGHGVLQAVRDLVAWAEQNGHADGQWLGYQWDDPEITALDECRYYVAVEADAFTPRGAVGRYKFPPMVVAQVALRGDLDLELCALRWLYGSWLPRSNYFPDNQPCFEAWHGRPFAHGTDHFELTIQLPICRM